MKTSRVLVTGSADGLGKMAAEILIAQGHAVTLHARSDALAETLKKAVPKAERVLVGDLASLAETRALAEQANLPGVTTPSSTTQPSGTRSRAESKRKTASNRYSPSAYSDSKLFNVLLAFAVARRWTSVLANSVEPGWVATKMGGPGAPDDLSLGPVTQAWLAVSDDLAARVSGRNFYHQQPRDVHPAASDPAAQ